jgi:hypothetical protein
MVLKVNSEDVRQTAVDIPEIATITTVDVVLGGLPNVKPGELYLVAFDLSTLDAGLSYSATAFAAPSPGKLTVRFCNPTAGAINPSAGITMTYMKL